MASQQSLLRKPTCFALLQCRPSHLLAVISLKTLRISFEAWKCLNQNSTSFKTSYSTSHFDMNICLHSLLLLPSSMPFSFEVWLHVAVPLLNTQHTKYSQRSEALSENIVAIGCWKIKDVTSDCKKVGVIYVTSKIHLQSSPPKDMGCKRINSFSCSWEA